MMKNGMPNIEHHTKTGCVGALAKECPTDSERLLGMKNIEFISEQSKMLRVGIEKKIA